MQAIVKFPVAIPLAVLLAAIIALVLAAPSVLAQDTEQPPTEAASGGGSGSAGARLAELDFHGVALEPRFHPEQADYQGYMYSREMGSTTVTATAADADATVTISPADADADVAGHQVDLTAGEDVSVEVTVTSSDGTSESVYTVAMKYGDGFAKLSVGRDNACALRKDGTVECWNGASEPAGVHQDVAGGSSGYVCGVRADGTMHCWGGIHYADTGVQAVEMFTHALCWLKTDGSIRCDGSYMPDLEGGAGRGPYQSVTVGYEFVCALTTGNLVKCVKTLDIFLPIPEPETEFKHIDSGGYAVCGIRMDDTLLCWKYITGSKSNYQLVFDRVIAATPVGEFKSVAAGTFFACAVKSADGSITCFKHTDTWGWSDRPRIGKILDNVPEGEFQRVGAGQFFACGLKTDDSIDCWDDRNHVQDPSMVSPRAGEAHLESLELSDPASAGVTLTPRFNGDTPGGYLAEVPAETPLITVTPVATNRFAEVIITPPDADPDTEGHQVALDVGTNSVSVTVTSWDDSAEKTYTLEIIRREQRTYNAAPAFDTLYRSVAENSPAGTPVGPPVVASDPDADPVTYSLRGADAASFRIDAATGQIYTVEGVEYDYETKPTYSVTARADDGYGPSATAQVVISLTDELQEDGSTPEQNTPATGQPTISGTAQVGETLTADTSGIADADGLTNVSYSYQWIASDGAADADISGATDATYTLTFAEAEKTIKVRVSFTDDAGNAESLTSAATDAVAATSQQQANRPATGQPVIGGTAQVGETLTADTSGISDDDGLDNATFAYQWAADGVDISGATGSSYTLVEADEGRHQRNGQLHRRRRQRRNADQRGDNCGGGESQHSGHRAARHQRHRPGGRDAGGGHLRHRRRGRADQRDVHLPVAGRWRGHRQCHRLRLHAGRRRRGQGHHGNGVLHRRCGERRNTEQRGHGGRRAQAQHPSHRSACHQRHGPSGRDAVGRRFGHRRRGRVDQPDVCLPVARRRCANRGRDGLQLHADRCRRREGHQRHGVLHRRPGPQ